MALRVRFVATLLHSKGAAVVPQRGREWNSWFCHNLQKPPEYLYTKHFGRFSTSKISHFLIEFRLKFDIFFDASFWALFFNILGRLGAKKLDFGSPFAPSWAQNGAQNRPSGAKWHPLLKPAAAFLETWNRFAAKVAFGAFLGTISSDFWQMLIPFSKICSIVRSAPGHNFFGFLTDFDSLFKDL